MTAQSKSVWKRIRLFLGNVLALLPGGADQVEVIRAWRCQRRCRAWMRAQRAKGCRYSPEMTFLRSYGYEWVEAQPGLVIDPGVTIWISNESGSQPNLVFGKRVCVGRHTFLGVHQPMHIGDNTIIGAYCYIISANHCYDSREIPIRDQGYTGAPIHICGDVWIGTHVVILPGVTIGKGAIIAAGSLVNHDVPEYEIWGGMPARFLKARPLDKS